MLPRRFAGAIDIASVKSRLTTFLLAAACVGLGLWVYLPALHGTWVWDDGEEIVRNAVIRGPLAALGTAWVAPAGPDYFPLKVSFQWLEWHLWGDAALGYHLASVCLHLTSALLVWRVLARLGLRLGWIGALVMILHPQAVESVAWIAELKNTLSLPLLLVACLAYLNFGDAAARGERGAWLWWALAILAYTASLLAKSTGVMFPFILVLYGWWRWGRLRWEDVRASIPFFGVSLGLGLVTLWYQAHRAIGAAASVHPAPLGVRLGNAGHALLFYAQKAVFPSGLAPIYPAWRFELASTAGAAGWILAAGALALCWAWRSSWGRHGLLGLGWFVLNLVPVLGIIPMAYSRISGASDHFAYLSLVGIAGLAAALAGSLLRLPGRRPILFGVGSGVGIGCLAWMAMESRALAGNYRSDEVFWRSAVAANDHAWIAHNNLGLIDLNAGRLDQAVAHFTLALSGDGGTAEVQNNLGQALARQGHFDLARAHLEAALKSEPRFFDAHLNLGNTLAQTGRFSEAADQYSQALLLQPATAPLECYLGYALMQAGRSYEAETHLREAIRLDPSFAEPPLRLGDVLGNAGRMEEAVRAYGEAIALKPDYPEALASLGLALAIMHRPAEAIPPLARAIALRPSYSEAHAYLGYALSGAGHMVEAVGEYREALKTGSANPELHYNLGMALRSLGRYPEARSEFDEAQRLERHR